MLRRAASEIRLLAVMVRAVRAGGRVVRRHFTSSRLEVREKSSPGDLVSNVDLEVERRVIGILSRAFPGTPVVSEEKDNPKMPAEAFYLDPLDGTLNFLHGLTPFAVSLAFWRDGQALAAAVHNPLSGELFTALRGRGARRNGRAIASSGVGSLRHALVAAGVLLVTEAGGRVSSPAGGQFLLQNGEVAASNGRIHAELLEQLKG